MPAIDSAINEESWDYLRDNLPTIAQAIQDEVNKNASAAEIRRFVFRKTHRDRLAARCQQAAEYLISENGSS
jgi:hypothetical protein